MIWKSGQRMCAKISALSFSAPASTRNLRRRKISVSMPACMACAVIIRHSARCQPYKKRVEELEEVVGIKDALFRPIKNLSGGMQRKLEIMRSLIHTPEIIARLKTRLTVLKIKEPSLEDAYVE